MKQNVGKTDKVIRLILGAAIAAAGIYYNSLWGFIAIITVATALAGFCPLYSIFGLSSCRARSTS